MLIFYLVRSEVFHIIPGGDHDYDVYHTLCGWNYRECKVEQPYYDAKLGPWRLARGTDPAYGRRLCRRCLGVLEPQKPSEAMGMRSRLKEIND